MSSNLLSSVAFSCHPSNANMTRPPTDRTATRTDSVNKYVYHSKNLLLSYGLAIGLALLANLLGAYAYLSNGVSHNRRFSAILAATRHESLTKLFHNQIVGSLPLSDKVKNTFLKFGPIGGRRKSLDWRTALGFQVVGNSDEKEHKTFGKTVVLWFRGLSLRLRVLLS